MDCYECGAPMSVAAEQVHYTACGLSNVYLDGVEVARCPSCGTVETAIPNMAALHRALARAIAEKPEPLTGEEIRFLRKHRGLSGVDLAREMGVTSETVSRWEHGKRMGPTAERLLRMTALYETKPPAFPPPSDHETPAPLRVTLRSGRQGWDLAHVAA